MLNPADSREEVEQSMATAEEAAGHAGIKAERVFLTGEPAEAIRKYLAENRTDTFFCSTRPSHYANLLMLWAMTTKLIWVWALLNVPAVQKVFNTAHVPLSDLWILLPFPVRLLLSHESYKWLRRRRVLI